MKMYLLILAVLGALFLTVFFDAKEKRAFFLDDDSLPRSSSTGTHLNNEKQIIPVVMFVNDHHAVELTKQVMEKKGQDKTKTTLFEEKREENKEEGIVTFTSMFNALLNDYYAEGLGAKDTEDFLKALATLKNKQYSVIVDDVFNQGIMNKDNALLLASSISLVSMNTQDGMDMILTKLADPTLSTTSRDVIASALATANSPEQFSVLNTMIEHQIEGYQYAIEGLFNTEGGMKYLVDKLSEEDSQQQRENTMAVIANLQDVRADIVSSFTDNLSLYYPRLLNEFMSD